MVFLALTAMSSFSTKPNLPSSTVLAVLVLVNIYANVMIPTEAAVIRSARSYDTTELECPCSIGKTAADSEEPNSHSRIVQIVYMGNSSGQRPREAEDDAILVVPKLHTRHQDRVTWKAKKFAAASSCHESTFFYLVRLHPGPSTVMQFRSRKTGQYIAMKPNKELYGWSADTSITKGDDTYLTVRRTAGVQHFFSTVHPMGIFDEHQKLHQQNYLAVSSMHLQDRDSVQLKVSDIMDHETRFRICTVRNIV